MLVRAKDNIRAPVAAIQACLYKGRGVSPSHSGAIEGFVTIFQAAELRATKGLSERPSRCPGAAWIMIRSPVRWLRIR